MSAVSESEFYDADQDFSDFVSQFSPSFSKDFETEVRRLRLNLREEIEKRKNAEKVVIDMQNWWRRMEIVVSRLVPEAVEKDLFRAETEAVADEVIDSKNHEFFLCKIECIIMKL